MTKEKSNGKIAIIRVRGSIGINRDIERALKQLMLYKKNYCVTAPNSKSYIGMISKVKDYTTWGDIDEETYDLLVEKRGEVYKSRLSDSKGKISYNGFLSIKDKKIKRYFRLNSPRRGYGKKGIKTSFKEGGALGYRADKIKDLIKRMI